MSASGILRTNSLTLTNSNNKVDNSTEFNDAWNPIIAARETNFVNHLNTWKTNNNLTITNLDNIFVFGNYKTTNWKISGLLIKSIPVAYYIASKNTTRATNTVKSLKILEKLFVGTNALFHYQENWTTGIENHDTRMNLKFNPSVYDDFYKREVTVQEIYDYVTKQTINAGTKDGFITTSDKVKWTSGTNENNWLNKKINDTKIPPPGGISNNKNWRLVINDNAFAMSFAHDVNNGQTVFEISRSSTNVWPDLPN